MAGGRCVYLNGKIQNAHQPGQFLDGVGAQKLGRGSETVGLSLLTAEAANDQNKGPYFSGNDKISRLKEKTETGRAFPASILVCTSHLNGTWFAARKSSERGLIPDIL